MNDIHEPAPEFLSHLEWQVRSALSRRDRWSAPAPSRTFTQAARIAALVLVSVFCGAAGVRVTEGMQDARQKEMLTRQAEIRLELARIQYDFMRTRAREIERLYTEGLIEAGERESGQMGVQDLEAEVVRRELDLAEIRASGSEPRNELTAPLVGGRDFVTERLTLQIERLRAHAEFTTRRFAADRERAGMEPGQVAVQELQVSRQSREFELQIEELARRLDLRRRFLAGELPAEEIERQIQRQEIESELMIQQGRLEHLRQQLARMKRLNDEGLVGDLEVRQVETQLRMQEMELQLLQLKLDYLRGGEDS